MNLLAFLFIYLNSEINFIPYIYFNQNFKTPALYSSLNTEYTFSKNFFYFETDFLLINYLMKNIKYFKDVYFKENISWFSSKYDLNLEDDRYILFMPKEFYFDLKFSFLTFRAGRFILPWQLNYFFSHFNFWTYLDRFSPFISEFNGIDGAGFILQKEFSKAEIYWLPLKTDTLRWGTKFKITLKDIDFLFVFKSKNQGGGVSFNLFEGVLRTECLLKGNNFKYAFSYDRFLPKNFYILFEFSKNYEFQGRRDDIFSFKIDKQLDFWIFSIAGFYFFENKFYGILYETLYDIREDINLKAGFFYDYYKKSKTWDLIPYFSFTFNF